MSHFPRRENNKEDCEQTKTNVWKEVWSFLERAPEFKSKGACEGARDGFKRIWATPDSADDPQLEECLVKLPEIECLPAPWTRPNHLGKDRIDRI